jgi:hypothetical protein
LAERGGRAAGVLAVAGLALCLPSCLSPVPLDPKPQADLDARVVGAWRYRFMTEDAYKGVAPTPAALRERIAKPGAFVDFAVCVPVRKE